MIKVDKDLSDIPDILTPHPSNGVSRKGVFEANIKAGAYIDGKNSYKVESVRKKLEKIYHLKCAYCETSLLDAPRHIEHYRPKDIYYWLAYSWDNLLLACHKCNSIKGSKFPVKNSRAKYCGESFEDIHNLGESYDRLEEPLIINPEKEDVLELIYFDKNGKIYSDDERVKYTIESACRLNRHELLQKRASLINDFNNIIKEHYFLYVKNSDITRFIPDIKKFILDCKKEKDFYALRYFVINNSDIFFENKPLQVIVKRLFKKFS